MLDETPSHVNENHRVKSINSNVNIEDLIEAKVEVEIGKNVKILLNKMEESTKELTNKMEECNRDTNRKIEEIDRKVGTIYWN
jgi:hypothetical protein